MRISSSITSLVLLLIGALWLGGTVRFSNEAFFRAHNTLLVLFICGLALIVILFPILGVLKIAQAHDTKLELNMGEPGLSAASARENRRAARIVVVTCVVLVGAIAAGYEFRGGKTSASGTTPVFTPKDSAGIKAHCKRVVQAGKPTVYCTR